MSELPGGPMTALVLRLQDEIFAIEAGQVREILEVINVTDVPNAPAFVRGLINVRGRVVPLADLRVVFRMDQPEPDVNTRIVVIEIELEGDPAIVAILADEVHGVTDIDTATITAAPRVGTQWRAEFVRGIGKLDGKFLIVPDLGRIFEIQGRGSVSPAEERAA